MPSSWDARLTYKGHVAYATNRGGAFTQAGRVPLGLRPALRHLFETTSVIRGLWKNGCFNILGPIPGKKYRETGFKEFLRAPCGVNPPCPHFCVGGVALAWGGKQNGPQS